MELRTVIDIPRHQPFTISHDRGIVMLGSCFTDNIGQRLERDGFDVTYNPMGTLYNPASVFNALSLALSAPSDRQLMTRQDADGKWHCLNFAARYLYDTREEMEADINAQLDSLADRVRGCRTIFITLGTSYVFHLGDEGIAGNCHKFPASCFRRVRLSVPEASEWIKKIIALVGPDKDLAFTISPIRHTTDGLHGNQLSKSTLLLALDDALSGTGTHYFPSYEIVLDDLRDYRFYAADMKHPSDVAADYIYEVMMQYYMTPSTTERAIKARKEHRRCAHRQIISPSSIARDT